MAVPDDIQQLAHAVPAPPGEPLPAGASDADLDAFAARTAVAIPPDLREWWQLTNGPCIGPGGIYGVRPLRSELDVEAVYDLYPQWRRRGWIPVAGDGCGDQYVLAADGSLGPSLPVFFFDHERADDPLHVEYVVASGLWPFLRFLLREELGEHGRPFDRAMVLAADPLLATCSPLPWDAWCTTPAER